MTKTELVKLLKRIKNRYPAYQVPEDSAQLRELIDDLHDDVANVPLETALENLRRYVAEGNEFPPNIPRLMRPLESQQDDSVLYHESLKRRAAEHRAEMTELWERVSNPSPEETARIKAAQRKVREIFANRRPG